MTILHITNIGGVLTAITDNNKIIPVEAISGSVRVGCSLNDDGEDYRVVGNNVDENCLNGVCSLSLPDNRKQGKGIR